MKIRGKVIDVPKPLIFAIPRLDEHGEPDDIIFTVKAVTDYTRFDQLCPRPKPRTKMQPGHELVHLTDEPAYVEKMDQWADRRYAYLILTSLSATEGLEWNTVNLDQPITWLNWEEELKTCLTDREVAIVLTKIGEVNAPTAERQREALDRFFQSQRDAQAEARSLEKAAADNTKSGEPVNA